MRTGPVVTHLLLVILVNQPRAVERVLRRRVTRDVDEPRVDVETLALGVGLEDAGRHRLGKPAHPRLTCRELLRRRGESPAVATVEQQQEDQHDRDGNGKTSDDQRRRCRNRRACEHECASSSSGPVGGIGVWTYSVTGPRRAQTSRSLQGINRVRPTICYALCRPLGTPRDKGARRPRSRIRHKPPKQHLSHWSLLLGRGSAMRMGRLGAATLVVALGCTSLAAVSAAGTTRSSTCATLGPGAVGPAVATVQRLVRADPDGDFGPLTAAAVTKWQKRHHVPPTGAVDAATWQAMPADVAQDACSKQVHGSGVAPTCAVLAQGARGPAVAVLQRKVGAHPDGDFGPVTAAAVKAAQIKAKLRPSGKAGPATWAALGLTGTPACMTLALTAAQQQAAANARAQQAIHDQVVKLAAALTATAGATSNAVASAAMTFARGQTGKPYRWGGAGPASYDCSGLVMASYLAAGITLPRIAADQYGAGSLVPLDQAQQGDLLFYASDLTRPATIYHVVLYAGRGRVLDAPHTGAVVGTRALWTSGLLPVAVRPVGQLRLPLVPGASGWSVAQLQQALDRHGARLSVDGGFGPQTAAAVRTWKAAHDLPGTARVGVRAWLTLGTSPVALPKG